MYALARTATPLRRSRNVWRCRRFYSSCPKATIRGASIFEFQTRSAVSFSAWLAAWRRHPSSASSPGLLIAAARLENLTWRRAGCPRWRGGSSGEKDSEECYPRRSHAWSWWQDPASLSLIPNSDMLGGSEDSPLLQYHFSLPLSSSSFLLLRFFLSSYHLARLSCHAGNRCCRNHDISSLFSTNCNLSKR